VGLGFERLPQRGVAFLDIADIPGQAELEKRPIMNLQLIFKNLKCITIT
jgi:hypothetical protein